MNKNTDELFELVLNAHGGLERWNTFTKLSAKLKIGGVTWAVKGHEGALSDVQFDMSIHNQSASFSPFISSGQRSVFTKDRVAIESFGGKVLKELYDPRASFVGHQIQTPWNKLQLIYFSSYATWSYLVSPFLFTWPGFELKELEPWQESGETWRRLEVIFPDGLAYHSKRQIYHYDQHGLLRKHDYWPDILGGAAATQYTYNYQDFDGIKVGISRKVFILNEDYTHQPEPVLVTLDIETLSFS